MSTRNGRASGNGALHQTTRVASERDSWVHAAPGRAFEVSFDPVRPVWRITLTERGREIARASGPTWDMALDAALQAARARTSE